MTTLSNKKNRLVAQFSSSLSSQLALRPELMDEVEDVLNKQKECSEKLEEQDELDDLDASIIKLENEIIQLENSIFFKFPVRWKKNEPEELTGMRKQYSELKDRIWREKTWLLREHDAFQDDEDIFPKKENGKKACFADGVDTQGVTTLSTGELCSTAYFKSGISPLSPYHVPKEFGKVHAAFKNNKWDYTLAPGTYEEYQRFFDEHEEDLEGKSLQEAYKLFLNIHQEHFSAYKGGIETSRTLYNDPHLEELRVPPPPSFTHGTYDKSQFDIRKQRFETIALSGEDSWKVSPSKKETPLADISSSQYNNNNFLRRQESWRQRIQPQQESATLPAQPRQPSNNSNFELRKKMWQERIHQEQPLSNPKERC